MLAKKPAGLTKGDPIQEAGARVWFCNTSRDASPSPGFPHRVGHEQCLREGCHSGNATAKRAYVSSPYVIAPQYYSYCASICNLERQPTTRYQVVNYYYYCKVTSRYE